MKTHQQTSKQFYESLFINSEYVQYGDSGRVLFGIECLQERTANLAAAWLQGGWKDEELREMLTTGLAEVVLDCAEYVDAYSKLEEGDFFVTIWKSFFEIAKCLAGNKEITTDAMKAALVLLPISSCVLASSFARAEGIKPSDCSVRIHPDFFEQIKNKAESLDCSVNLESNNESVLAETKAQLNSVLKAVGRA